MRVVIIISALFLALCYSSVTGQTTPPAQPENQNKAAVLPTPDGKEDRYRIGYQDTLEVQVFRHPDLNQRVSVNPNGSINLFRLDEPIVAVCKKIGRASCRERV